MPGPLSKHDKNAHYEDRKPNKKSAARLARRIDAYNPGNEASGLLCHRPGSQNRKK